MFTKLLLIGSALLANGSVLTLETPLKLHNPGDSEDFYYLTDLFPESEPSFSFPVTDMTVTYAINDIIDKPEVTLNYIYFGDLLRDYNFYGVSYEVESYVSGDIYTGSIFISSSTESFPFAKATNGSFYNRFEYSLGGMPIYLKLRFWFQEAIPINQQSIISARFKHELALTNAVGISEYITSEVNAAYDKGYGEGVEDTEVSDGTWLGSLVFGTIGGIVGLLFTISDFEVLGVSIMSIITLFVAIGVIMLLIKVLK